MNWTKEENSETSDLFVNSDGALGVGGKCGRVIQGPVLVRLDNKKAVTYAGNCSMMGRGSGGKKGGSLDLQSRTFSKNSWKTLRFSSSPVGGPAGT